MLTDTVTGCLSYVNSSLTATQGIVDDSTKPTLRWSAIMTTGQVITISFQAQVTQAGPKAITNRVDIAPQGSPTLTRTTTLIVNPLLGFLPLVLKP